MRFLTVLLTVSFAFLLTVLSARAEYMPGPYTGEYRWLTYFHTTGSESATYWNGPTAGMGWGWLAARGVDSTDNRWRQITWDRDVSLTGCRLAAFSQFAGGSIGTYNLEYSADGSTGWLPVPTATTLSGTTSYNITFSSAVTARGLRVFFPGGSYNQGTGGNGPGVYQLLARGSVVGGIDPSDPQFNILATTGIPGVTPVASIPSTSRALQSGSPSNWIDAFADADGNRAGWYTPPGVVGNEGIKIDLGPNDGDPFLINTVRLYGGTYYYYMPSSLKVYVSSDGLSWGSAIGTMSAMTGGLQVTGLNAMGRYVLLADAPVGLYYFLPHEVAIGALPMPEPASLCLLALGGLALFRRRK